MEKLNNKLTSKLSLNYNTRKKIIGGTKSVFTTIFRLLILLSIGYIIIYPLFQMIVTSIKSEAAFYDAARVWIPSSTNIIYNYSKALYATDYWNGLTSTLFFEIVAGLIEVVTCSIVAYGFARFKFKFKGLLMACLFATILIPETMIIIPRMTNYSQMDILGIFGLVDSLTGVDLRPNLIDTPLAFWLPSLFAVGLRSGILTYIYIQFFKGLPYELEEASWVDGAGPIKTFVSIAIPSSGVVFTTVIVFSIIWHWNDTFLSSMYLFKNFPLAVNLDRIEVTLGAMGFFTSTNVDAQAVLMASCILFLLPPLVLYMILQKRFIESIDRVGITG